MTGIREALAALKRMLLPRRAATLAAASATRGRSVVKANSARLRRGAPDVAWVIRSLAQQHVAEPEHGLGGLWPALSLGLANEGHVLQKLDLSHSRLDALPRGLHVRDTLNLSDCHSLAVLPKDLEVDGTLDLTGCAKLCELPAGLRVGRDLILRGCKSLPCLPSGVRIGRHLDMCDCTSLVSLPDRLFVEGSVDLTNCVNLKSLPKRMWVRGNLILHGCESLSTLPSGLFVGGVMDLGGTRVGVCPPGLSCGGFAWNGQKVATRVASRPETITVKEIIEEKDAALRRVLLERFTVERFIMQAKAEVLDWEPKVSGERKLLRVKLPGDEDLVCLTVQCPATGALFVRRVPPQVRSCRDTAVWTGSFDQVEDYRPFAET